MKMEFDLADGRAPVVIDVPDADAGRVISFMGEYQRLVSSASAPQTPGEQIGTSDEADFERSTWTFQMPPGFTVSAGRFRITPVGASAAPLPYNADDIATLIGIAQFLQEQKRWEAKFGCRMLAGITKRLNDALNPAAKEAA